jgi:hypothetical protein
MKNFMGFDDIFNVDDILEDAKDSAEGSVSDEEKNSGLWDSGTKENIWRAGSGGDPSGDPNAVWDAGGCPSCPDDCEECDTPEDDETCPQPEPSEPENEAEDTSGGIFDDIF